jgi:hypothetical protein
MDMHCHPFILIQLQGCLYELPRSTETLNDLSHFIWNNSSKYNVRIKNTLPAINKHDLLILDSLNDIQYMLIKKLEFEVDVSWIKSDLHSSYEKTTSNITDHTSRLAFMLMFGKSLRLDKKVGGKQYNIVVAGNAECPFKAKRTSEKNRCEYVEGKDMKECEKYFIEQTIKKKICVDLNKINPPNGYKWKQFYLRSPLNCYFTYNHDKICMMMESDDEMYNMFDGKKFIVPHDTITMLEVLPDDFTELLNVALYNTYGNVYETLLHLVEINKVRRLKNDIRIFDWKPLTQNIPQKVWMIVRSRILMTKCGDVHIGPVDRKGNKTQFSISYRYEGVIWRLLIVLASLYPNVLKYASQYKFTLDSTTIEFMHMIKMLDELIVNNKNKTDYNGIDVPQIVTKLWEHQLLTSDAIVRGFTHDGKKGFGDASDVGSGKTLTALSICQKILQHCVIKKVKCDNSGILIMLPTENLYDTWKTEIDKHTKGFNVCKQHASGKLCDKIKHNTLVITTMGRMRDHPINHPWLLVIIDECLTVQNKEALQTEEAWRQTLNAKFGVIMLSATFFRSRFEKMLYMISMLNTQIPETSEYIDLILSETMVCNIKEHETKWTVLHNKYSLIPTKQKQYDKLATQHKEIGFEKTYMLLQKFIFDNVDYIKLFGDTIKSIIAYRPNAKCLIYAKSKSEADMIAANISNVGRYPDKKTHTVVSYAEGTFGLNNLTEFNTIVTRPPDPDKLPQIKGRLDRPNQKAKVLYIHYILLEKTIEEAGLYKLELSRNFYGQHILPLAKFYEMAVSSNSSNSANSSISTIPV